MTPLNLLGFLKFTQLYAVIVVCTSLQNADGTFNPMKTSFIQTPFLQNGSGYPQIVSDNWNIASDSTTTDEPPETTRTSLHEVFLDLENPEDERGFTSTTAVIYRLPANDDDYSSYRLAIHLKTCDYDDNELIWIGKDTGNVTWRCSKKASNARHVGDPYVEVQHFLDDAKEVIIKTNFTSSNYNRNKAVIVVNLYRDFDRPSRCPRGYFDCQQSLCQNISKKNSRCIPSVLKCDGSPNCGMTGNVDETNEVCHAETYCRGWYLTGSYGVLSLAMVVLFVGNYS
ncbi:hypothetical protein Ocin01_15770 [Orchesella cincta]|uniref:Uncharacterized protein n=1 Tax=Orchesella cincta TaxID=48709 RepID=A0A1D2MD30_ORCCI|nr:hypothetical protein Ocin01_15770 [Orchesella cincta]